MSENQDQAVVAAPAAGPKVIKMTISSLLQDLKDGTSREDMATKYGVTKAAITEAFKHPKLKGKRVIHEGVRKTGSRKKFIIELEDDTEGTEEGGSEAQTTEPQTEAQPEAQSEFQSEATNETEATPGFVSESKGW